MPEIRVSEGLFIGSFGFLVFSFQQSFPPAWIGARIAFHLVANEFVEGFAFEFEFAGFFAEGFDLFCFIEFLGAGGAEFWALFFCAVGAVEAVDEGPVEVAARVEAPVARDDDHGAVGSRVDADFEQEGAVVFHAVEFPAVAEGVEEEREPSFAKAMEDRPSFVDIFDF